MINVDTLYQKLRALAKKDKAGYVRNNVFNLNMNTAQNVLFEYYWDMFQRTQKPVEALEPFLVRSEINISSGVAALPSDYAHKLDVEYRYIVNGTTPTVEYVQMLPKAQNESRRAYRSPNLSNAQTLAYEMAAEGIRVYPETLSGKIRLKYLKYPPSANRAITLDTTNDEENYNAGSSTQLVWRQQDETNFLDLLLFFLGIEIRDTELVNWVAGKKRYQKEQFA